MREPPQARDRAAVLKEVTHCVVVDVVREVAGVQLLTPDGLSGLLSAGRPVRSGLASGGTVASAAHALLRRPDVSGTRWAVVDLERSVEEGV